MLLIYFRVIKASAADGDSAVVAPDDITADDAAIDRATRVRARAARRLLPATLRGLARVTHLMNIDVAVDLLAALRELLQRHGTNATLGATSATTAAVSANNADATHANSAVALPPRAALHCVRTAARTLGGVGRELPVDDGAFTGALFALLRTLGQSERAAAAAAARDRRPRATRTRTRTRTTSRTAAGSTARARTSTAAAPRPRAPTSSGSPR